MTERKLFRCAIYTRKSSEEGLEQAFNSLDAQREACSAYILSQAGEGWKEVKTQYDDGGYSGGSMDRPALRQLLRDISAGKIDIVVVYKVDRLTRALSDFDKIVETLDAKKASFVSVTQAFNTTTSMGRLTLNVLLSFAQFEREVTGERIRDKIAASRRKGMWMGGSPPLGYDVVERKLIINDAERQTVRHIYARYLEIGSVGKLVEELARDQFLTKSWTSASGIRRGDVNFNRGTLYHLLKNRLYLGEAVHKGKSYPGEHVGIVDQHIWDRTQALLTTNAQSNTKRSIACVHANPLLGMLHDDRGNLMTPTYTGRSKGRHRYYVSQALLQNRKSDAGSLPRVPAGQIEDVVEKLALRIFSEPLKAKLRTNNQPDRFAALRSLVHRIEVTPDALRFVMSASQRSPFDRKAVKEIKRTFDHCDTGPRVSIPVSVVSRGSAKLVLSAGSPVDGYDSTLVKALARAWRLRQMLETGRAQSLPALAKQEGVHESYLRKLLGLAFLCPTQIEQILSGRQPIDANLATSLEFGAPVLWGHGHHAMSASLMPSRFRNVG